MKHKVSELSGALLDAAVAKVEGLRFKVEYFMTNPPRPGMCWLADEATPPNPVPFENDPYRPSADWATGGPLLEKHGIFVVWLNAGEGAGWYAFREGYGESHYVDTYASEADGTGETYLLAGMRALVHKAFGDEVDL